MGLTKNQRAIALVAGLALVLSACAGNADPDPSPSEGGGTETSVEPSATVAPVDKRVVEGFVMADARLSPPAGAKWLSGEEEQLWSDDKQLGLMVFDDHHPDSENYPTVELRYSPRHFSREAAAAEVSMIFPEGEFGEPVTIEGQTFERFVGSGELLVGSDYVETPGEVFFARRNEGTYFLYVLGLPGESEISDELRQTAFDALKFDTSTVDEYFPPGQDEGAVTLELESLATYEVGVDIEPGRYEVYAEAPSDVPMVDIFVSRDDGGVYDAYRPVALVAAESHDGPAWAGFIELHEGDQLHYDFAADPEETPDFGSVTFKPLPEPTVYRTVLPGSGDWVSGVDFKPGTYQMRGIMSAEVAIFDPDGAVIFDGRISGVDFVDRMEFSKDDSFDYMSRELMIPRLNGMAPLSTAIDLPAGSRIVTWADFLGNPNALELVPAPRATDVPTPVFTADPGHVNEQPTGSGIVVGQELEPGVYTLTDMNADAGASKQLFVDTLGGDRLYSLDVFAGVQSDLFYLPSNSVVHYFPFEESPDLISIEPAQPVPFEGGIWEGRIMRVGTDIEPGTWTISGTSGLLDVFDSEAQLVKRVAVWNPAVEHTLELEEGQIIVDSVHNVPALLTFEKN